MTAMKFCDLFSNHMVIQRETPIPVWGDAPNETEIFVTLNGYTEKAIAKNGTWKCVFPAMDAGGPYTLMASIATEKIVVEDVYIGEVWLAGGQSNMSFTMETVDTADDINDANYPEIRFFSKPFITYEKQAEEFPESIRSGNWTVCTPETARNFSAFGYYFAKNLHETLGVSVGIISADAGGTSGIAFLDTKYLEDDPDLRVYVEEYNNNLKTLDWESYEQSIKMMKGMRLDRYVQGMPGEDRPSGFPGGPGGPGDMMDPDFAGMDMPVGPKSDGRPGGLYDFGIKSLAPYAVRGVIFAHGETDTDNGRPRLYGKLFEAIIRCWRDTWNMPDMPFIFTQAQAFGGMGGISYAGLYPATREEQWKLSKRVANTAMVVAYDCGDEMNIHYPHKKPVAERMFHAAMGMVYGKDDAYIGPELESTKVENGKAFLRFTSTGGGLECHGSELKGFTIAGIRYEFYPARAEIVDDHSIVVYNDKVKNPKAVRYAWANFTEANLYGKNGLPCGPFRTDKYT